VPDKSSPLPAISRRHRALSIVTSGVAEASFQESIEGVGAMKKGPPLYETTDNHRQNHSFSDVHRVGITVRKLGAEVDTAVSFVDTFKAECAAQGRRRRR